MIVSIDTSVSDSSCLDKGVFVHPQHMAQYINAAPALPPAQDSSSVFVSSVESLPQEASLDLALQPIHPSLATLPTEFITGVAATESVDAKTSSLSMGFVSVPGLSNALNFVGQAFRSALFGSAVVQPLYSSTMPIQWVSQDSWQGKSRAADIRVRRVNASAQVAQLENSAWSADFIDQCMPEATRQLEAGVRYKVSIGERTLGYVADETRAYLIAQQLKRLIRQASFDPEAIAAYPIAESSPLLNASAVVGTPDRPMFAINDAMSTAVGYSPDWAAISWANNLRLALDTAPLQPGEAFMNLKGLEESKIDIAGEASWYGPYFHGRATANGETYDQYDLTVAHKSLPFGTQLKVRNVVNDKTVVVRVNDRGPYVGDRILDLSRAAADCLGSDQAGVIPVEAMVLKKR